MTRKKSEDAVSPVIGVMLMLVVTVVIAAVVAVFATGMVEDTEPAPIAKLDVKIISDQPITGGESIANPNDQYSGTVPTLHLTHVSGDSLNTENLKLSFSWECDNPACTQGHQHTSTYQAGKGEAITSGTSAAFDGKAFAPSGYGDTVEPLYINYGKSGGGFFGNHILKRGETMIAFDKHLMVPSNGVEHAGNPAMDVLFNNGVVITEYDEQVVTETTGPSVLKCNLCGEVDENASQFADCSKTPGCPGFIIPIAENIITTTGGTGYSAGIMACLTEGTAVKVIITHTPSSKVIYEDRVFVE